MRTEKKKEVIQKCRDDESKKTKSHEKGLASNPYMTASWDDRREAESSQYASSGVTESVMFLGNS